MSADDKPADNALGTFWSDQFERSGAPTRLAFKP